MATIAVVGAGQGVGAAVARRFGKEGFSVALIARSQDKLDALAGGLEAEGVTARGYAADVTDPAGLTAALTRAAADLGPIEVLQYSPIPDRRFLRPVLESSVEDIQAAVQFSVVGSITAAQAVLGAMRAAGRGTIVLINGGTSVRPIPKFAGTSVGFAGESAYFQILHEALKEEGVHVGQLVVPGGIIPDDPTRNPAAIAERIWSIHAEGGDFRRFLVSFEDVGE